MKEMVNVHAAKTNFSKLLARVASGEEFVIAKGRVPVAKLVPYASDSQPRPLGMFADGGRAAHAGVGGREARGV